MSAVSSAVEAAITGPELVSARLTVEQQLDLRIRLVHYRSDIDKMLQRPALLCHKDTVQGT